MNFVGNFVEVDTYRVDKVVRQAQDQIPTKERNVNDTLQRQRRCATEPKGCLFQIITNPEWPNGVAPHSQFR
jgi:hypothetical protein